MNQEWKSIDVKAALSNGQSPVKAAMTKSHKDAKDFLLGAFIGGMIGIAAVSLSHSGRKKNSSAKYFIDSLNHVGKAITSSGRENSLADIIDWTAEGIQLWTKLKKGN
jgi:gas vesicle protein